MGTVRREEENGSRGGAGAQGPWETKEVGRAGLRGCVDFFQWFASLENAVSKLTNQRGEQTLNPKMFGSLKVPTKVTQLSDSVVRRVNLGRWRVPHHGHRSRKLLLVESVH